MLNIQFGEMPDAIYNTAVYFKNTYQPKWLTDPFAQQMIEDVDRSHVVSEQVIESPVFGVITPLQLSGGLKTLLLIANDKSAKHVFNRPTDFDISVCTKVSEYWYLRNNGRWKIVFHVGTLQ